MGIIEKRKIESVDPMKVFVPDIFIKPEDPPMQQESVMEQLPHIDTEPLIAVGIMECTELNFYFDCEFGSPNMAKRTFFGSYSAHIHCGKIIFDGNEYESITFSPIAQSNFTSADGCFALSDVMIGKQFHWQKQEIQRFKGSLRLIADKDKMVIINDIPCEAYLYSVISSEMNAHAPLELLKAHAIISRSWLLKPKFEKQCNTNAVQGFADENRVIKWYERDAHSLFDVCADDHCQRYQGIGRATTTSVAEAINATRGMVLTFGSQICDARFSKCCGGVSERFSSCWADTDFHYLDSITDAPVVDLDTSPTPDLTIEENAQQWIRQSYNSWCNTTDTAILDTILNDYDRTTPDFYRWQVNYTAIQLSDIVRRKSGIDFGIIQELIPVRRGASGRIVQLRIVGSKRTVEVGKELEIRRWLSESHLYSSAFVVDKSPDGFIITGAGWGHGVGLCQIGAAVMAANGFDYKQILNHYFTDASINTIYH